MFLKLPKMWGLANWTLIKVTKLTMIECYICRLWMIDNKRYFHVLGMWVLSDAWKFLHWCVWVLKPSHIISIKIEKTSFCIGARSCSGMTQTGPGPWTLLGYSRTGDQSTALSRIHFLDTPTSCLATFLLAWVFLLYTHTLDLGLDSRYTIKLVSK